MIQPEDEAKDIALSLELFVNGSLNIFNNQTNVELDNRFTVYGIRDLGTELSPITMLVMMESIQNGIVENGKRGKATWLYMDCLQKNTTKVRNIKSYLLTILFNAGSTMDSYYRAMVNYDMPQFAE